MNPDTTPVLQLAYRGAPMTVNVIRDAALRSQSHYSVRRLVEEICQGLGSKDYLSETLAIYHWVCAHTRYMRDPRTVELVRAPYLVVEEIRSGKIPSLDCDDLTALICALLLMSGSECAAVTVAFRDMFFNGERQFSHVFAQAIEPGTRTKIVLDPVAHVRTSEMLGRVVAAKIWPIA